MVTDRRNLESHNFLVRVHVPGNIVNFTAHIVSILLEGTEIMGKLTGGRCRASAWAGCELSSSRSPWLRLLIGCS